MFTEIDFLQFVAQAFIIRIISRQALRCSFASDVNALIDDVREGIIASEQSLNLSLLLVANHCAADSISAIVDDDSEVANGVARFQVAALVDVVHRRVFLLVVPHRDAVVDGSFHILELVRLLPRAQVLTRIFVSCRSATRVVPHLALFHVQNCQVSKLFIPQLGKFQFSAECKTCGISHHCCHSGGWLIAVDSAECNRVSELVVNVQDVLFVLLGQFDQSFVGRAVDVESSCVLASDVFLTLSAQIRVAIVERIVRAFSTFAKFCRDRSHKQQNNQLCQHFSINFKLQLVQSWSYLRVFIHLKLRCHF